MGKKLSRSVYYALKFGDPPPLAYLRLVVARTFGWTLEYVDSLSPHEFFDILWLLDGEAKAGQKGTGP